MKFDVRIEDAAAKTALKRARSEIGSQTKQGLLKGAEALLPRVKVAAPRVVAEFLIARATTKKAYITTRGPKVQDRIAGLLEFGGNVTTPIFPKNKLALKIGDTGDLVATVATPRKYTGQHYIHNAMAAGMPVAEAVASKEVLTALHRLGL